MRRTLVRRTDSFLVRLNPGQPLAILQLSTKPGDADPVWILYGMVLLFDRTCLMLPGSPWRTPTPYPDDLATKKVYKPWS